jgi:hypothetical protein
MVRKLRFLDQPLADRYNNRIMQIQEVVERLTTEFEIRVKEREQEQLEAAEQERKRQEEEEKKKEAADKAEQKEKELLVEKVRELMANDPELLAQVGFPVRCKITLDLAHANFQTKAHHLPGSRKR